MSTITRKTEGKKVPAAAVVRPVHWYTKQCGGVNVPIWPLFGMSCLIFYIDLSWEGLFIKINIDDPVSSSKLEKSGMQFAIW